MVKATPGSLGQWGGVGHIVIYDCVVSYHSSMDQQETSSDAMIPSIPFFLSLLRCFMALNLKSKLPPFLLNNKYRGPDFSYSYSNPITLENSKITSPILNLQILFSMSTIFHAAFYASSKFRKIPKKPLSEKRAY